MTARTAPGPEDLSTPQTGRPPHTTAVDGGTAGATRIRPTGDRCPLPSTDVRAVPPSSPLPAHERGVVCEA